MITSKMCFDKFGTPGLPTEVKYMVVFDVPTELEIGIIPKKIYCNKLIVEPLKQAFKNLIDRKYVSELKTWDGCYQVRKMRGLKFQSLHSWGIAVDLNQATNQLGKQPTLSSGFVKCFTDAGFDWGGVWKRKDGMHFQLSKF